MFAKIFYRHMEKCPHEDLFGRRLMLLIRYLASSVGEFLSRPEFRRYQLVCNRRLLRTGRFFPCTILWNPFVGGLVQRTRTQQSLEVPRNQTACRA